MPECLCLDFKTINAVATLISTCTISLETPYVKLNQSTPNANIDAGV